MTPLKLTPFTYHSPRSGQTYPCLRINFPYADHALKARLKALGMRWAKTEKYFFFQLPPNISEAAFRQQIEQALVLSSPKAEKRPAPHPVWGEAQQALLQRYQQRLLVQRYSHNTAKSYAHAFRGFLAYAAPRLPLDLDQAAIEAYLVKLIKEKGISESYQNLIINAIKFYYELVEGRPRTYYNLPRPRRHDPLPKVLDKTEVQAMLSLTANLKHRCMLMLLYGGGLRLGEVIGLTLDDINLPRGSIRIHRGKGKKDREVPLPGRLAALLTDYLTQYAPLTFFFEGQTVGEAYSARSLQQVVKQAAARAGIKRPVTAHMLRHSYATHLLERTLTSATSRKGWAIIASRPPRSIHILQLCSAQASPVSTSPCRHWTAWILGIGHLVISGKRTDIRLSQ
jgi:integrase/recombinase XerD